MKRYFCTLFDKNYLTRGLALHDSLLRHCPDFHLWILCMDDLTYEILSKLRLEKVTLITLEDFEDKQLLKIKPTRTQGEYCWTCTPSLLLYVFKNYPKVNFLSYLDADLYFYSSPEPIFDEFDKDSVMIIPHRFTSNKRLKEAQAGVYNVSMVTFRRDKNGLTCLNWWRNRCLEWCYNRYEDGKIGDQGYLDQFPKLFKKVHILKYVGANVAPWNIYQYRVLEKNARVYIDDVTLIFYHFLGLKLYPKLPLLPPSSVQNYGQRTVYRKLIYNQYFQKLYEMVKIVRNIFPDFSFGFAPKPTPEEFFKEITTDVLSKIYSQFSAV